MPATKTILQGHCTAIGMRTKVEEDDAIIINTCSGNDSSDRGTPNSWTWCNPTNRAITHFYEDIQAVSLECLWQACKIREGMTAPDPTILNGNWRAGKGKKPIGAYAGPGKPLICTPGEARRKIYTPAFKNLIDHWMQDEEVASWVAEIKLYDGLVFFRDHDVGRGVDRNGPLSHAWLLCEWLNNGTWPC